MMKKKLFKFFINMSFWYRYFNFFKK